MHMRRPSSPAFAGYPGKVNPVSGALVALALAALVIASVLFLKSGGFSSLEPLPALQYQNNPTNFLGNRYRLTGQIHSMLLWQEGTGKLVAVQPEGLDSRVAVFVPDSLGVSLHTGQRYHMDIVVREGGLIYVEDLVKY